MKRFHWGISKRINLFAIIMVVLIIVMGAITYHMAEKIIVENYEKTTEANLNVISRYFSSYNADIRRLTLDIAVDEDLRDYAFGDMTDEIAIRRFKNKLYSRIQSLIISRDGICRVTVLCKDNDGFTVMGTGKHASISQTLAEQYFETDEAKHFNGVSAYGEWGSEHPVLYEALEFPEESCGYYFIRNIIAYRAKVGILLTDISESFISKTLLESNLPVTTSLSYISADGGEISTAKDAEVIRITDTDLLSYIRENEAPNGHRFVKIAGKHYILIYSAVEATDDYLTALIPIRVVFKQTEIVRIISILIVLGAVAVALAIGLGIANTFGKTISLTKDVVKKAAEGDMSVRFHEISPDEFGIINSNFNKILDSFVEAGERTRVAEIRALEAQINPHFLYNTLDAINFVALDSGAEDVSSMITDLADILRYSINDSNATVPISSEVDYLRKYIHLQQRRFKYSFSCLLDVDPDAMGVYLHKLILQPLIENSIVHAFVGRTEDNQIEVHITRDGNDIQIRVSDNGIGITPGLLKEINEFTGYEDNRGNIGIRNVLARLKMYYGDKCKVVASSDENGTVFTIDIEGIASENSDC